jgi:thiamine-monophosphate kinase
VEYSDETPHTTEIQQCIIDGAIDRSSCSCFDRYLDGLISALTDIANASHVQIEIDRAALQGAEGFDHLESLAREHGGDVWNWILHGGEDRAFVATVPAGSTLPSGFFEIGRVVEGSRVLVDGFIAEHQGFNHFA